MFCKGRFSMHTSFCTVKSFCSSPSSSSSSYLTTIPLPSKRETHLWYITPDQVKDASLLDQYLNVLSPCEKENVLRLRGDKLQRSAILARTLVDWQCDKNWEPPPLHFNLSHTSSLIACGVTVDMPIGIDVEEKQRKTRNNLLSLAQRYFTLDEVDYLNTISNPEIQRQEFIKLWTLKEAYVKALGRGFSAAPFNTFTIRFRGTSRSSLQKRGDSNSKESEIIVETLAEPKNVTTNWRFTLLELASSHYAAICVENKRIKGVENDPPLLKVWKTVPFIKDELLSETDSVRTVSL
ncbi:hypothetical protein IFM89_031340 [Coptis chinensis]|uniref:holo-[acyl-carrier-protein] synthase n=1 Tax=Coptis chinensis TaxID=261450 RepID=A0A835MB71_9MAGN|nr:hypothetical protein IFM89_031340 [Coptis chinensis]